MVCTFFSEFFSAVFCSIIIEQKEAASDFDKKCYAAKKSAKKRICYHYAVNGFFYFGLFRRYLEVLINGHFYKCPILKNSLTLFSEKIEGSFQKPFGLIYQKINVFFHTKYATVVVRCF